MVSSSPASRLLLAPCIKLLCLIIILPFIITYYHLQYYAYRRNEYCFVGRGWDDATATFFPPSSSAAAARSTSSGGDIDIVDNRLRGDSTTQSLLSMDGINDEHSVVKSEMIFGIYAPTISAAQLRQKKKRQKQPIEQRQFRQVYTTSDIVTTTSILSRFIGGVGYPSVTQLSAVISSPSSSASISNSNQHDITLVETSAGGKRWCLQSSTGSSSASLSREDLYCSDTLILPSDDDGSSAIYLSPPSGTWNKSIDSSNSSDIQASSLSSSSASHIVVSCPSPTTMSDSDAGRTTKKKHNSRWQQQNERQNQNVQSLLNQPATSLLLLLNIGLAFHYWNHRISPSSVCKRYTNIVDEHEWWRGLSGATAHFEPLHIGFNCMSLHSLGRELEGERGLYGSIPFLVYNIALVVCTTMVMMGMVYARLRYIQTKLNDDSNNNNASSTLRTYYQEMHDRLRETSTVGYSAVLFAWMVVSTMERTQPTCPIPFLSDVCFETHSVPGIPSLKFNIAPVASLFLAQFIMPRASFMGHLAGIICGFCLHWGWFMPPLEVCSPNVLFGGVFLIGLIWRRRVIPVKPLLLAAISDEEGCAEHEDYLRSLLADDDEVANSIGEEDGAISTHNQNGIGSMMDHVAHGKKKKREREVTEARQKRNTLVFVRNLIGVVTFASLLVFDWNSSLVLAQIIVLAYFVFGSQSSMLVWAYTRSKVENDIITPEKQRSGMTWRGMLMSTTLTIVVDSMSCASWFALPVISAAWRYSSRGKEVGLLPISLFMAFRTSANLCAMVISSKILHDMGEIGDGIFLRIFSNVIQWSKNIGDHVVVSKRPLWTAFEGRGIALGRRESST